MGRVAVKLKEFVLDAFCKLACLRKALPCGKNKNMAMRAKTSCFDTCSYRFRMILKAMNAKDFFDSTPHGVSKKNCFNWFLMPFAKLTAYEGSAIWNEHKQKWGRVGETQNPPKGDPPSRAPNFLVFWTIDLRFPRNCSMVVQVNVCSRTTLGPHGCPCTTNATRALRKLAC